MKNKKEKEVEVVDTKTSVIKLILWFVFIFVIILALRISTNTSNNKVKEEVVYEELDTMKSKLLENNYSYSYSISMNEDSILYSGVKCHNVDNGYKETSDGIIEYKINDEGIHVGDVLIDNLYEGIDSNYLNLEYVFNNLSSNYNIVNNDNNTRVISYENISIETDLDNIRSIIINVDSYVYRLSFTNIGLCDNIN